MTESTKLEILSELKKLATDDITIYYALKVYYSKGNLSVKDLILNIIRSLSKQNIHLNKEIVNLFSNDLKKLGENYETD